MLYRLLFPKEVLATDPINNPFNPTTDHIGFTESLARALIAMGFVIGAIVFILMFIYGAILWISSEGDQVKNENARKTITNALVGIFILLSLYAIINLVEAFFGFSITNFDVGVLQVSP